MQTHHTVESEVLYSNHGQVSWPHGCGDEQYCSYPAYCLSTGSHVNVKKEGADV